MTKELIVTHHLARQKDFSENTFGPGNRTEGVVKHISKELIEVMETNGTDLMEWIDIVILACDGAMRAGFTPQEISDAWEMKQTINEGRKWPDWRTHPHNAPIEHIK